MAAVFAFSLPAWAQPPAADATIILDPVIVSARGYDEPIRRVPYSLMAIGGEEIREDDLRDTQALARRVPNFNHADSGLPFSNLINIRGVGSSSALISPSVTYSIDGLPVPVRIFDMPFGDVERIEVLRGPQGTLNGLNSQAGAVNIVTGDPSIERRASLSVTVGSYGRKEVDASLEGALSDTVSGRIGGRLHDFDGDLFNVLWSAPGVVASTERDVRARTDGTMSGKLLIEPDADDRLTLFGAWNRDRQNPTTGVWLDDPGFPRNAFNPLPELEQESGHLGARYEHQTDWGRFTSISGLYAYDIGLEADIVDGFLGSAQTGLPRFAFQTPGLNVRRIDERSTQASQELRLDGETEGGVRWVGGVNGVWSTFDSTTDITSLALPNGSYQGRIDTTTLAAFGETTVPVTDRLRWTAGARLTFETKEFDGRFQGRRGARPFFQEGGNLDYVMPTGRTGLTFDLTDTLTAFATVARGEKSGGYLFYNQFAARAIPLDPYRSSSTWSYEAGLKAAELGGWLDLSTSVFLNDTTDEQLFTFNPILGRFSVVNADTRGYGAELEARVRASDAWSLGASLALLHAEIVGGGPIAGNDVPYAPTFSGTVYGEYRHSLDIAHLAGSAFLRGEVGYTGEVAIDPANSRSLDDYGLVNVRAGWKGERLEVFTGVENLFDREYATSAFQAGSTAAGRPVFAGMPGERRTFLLGARVEFQ